MAGTDGNAAGQTSGNLTIDQVNAAIDAVLNKALGPVSETIKSLGENQKVIADTLSKLPPAQPATQQQQGEGPKPLTAEDVAKIFDDRTKALQQSESQKSLVQRFIDDLRGKKVPDEIIKAHLPQNGDEKALTEGSAKAVARWNELGLKPADTSTSKAEGGTPNGGQGSAVTLSTGALTPGQQAAANAIKLPTAPATAA